MMETQIENLSIRDIICDIILAIWGRFLAIWGRFWILPFLHNRYFNVTVRL